MYYVKFVMHSSLVLGGGGGGVGWGEEQKMCVGFLNTHFKATYVL